MEQDNNTEINLFELIAKSYKFILKNKLLIISSFIIFGTIGFFKARKAPPGKTEYTKEFIGVSPTISDKILSTLLKNIQLTVTKGNDEEIEELSKQINIPLLSIKDITISETFRENANKQGVNISITATNKENFPKIIKGLENYINSNPYVIEEFREFIIKKQNYLHLINEEINDINTKKVEFDRKSDKVAVLFRLKQEKPELEFSLNSVHNAFQFVELNSPVITINTTNNNKLITITYGIGGIILAMFIAFIPIFIKSVKQYL